MPVSPEYVDRIAATVAELYRHAESQLAALMAQHLAGGLDGEMQSPEWAARKLAAVRSLRASASAILAALQADSGPAIRQAAADAFRAGWSSALAELPEQWFPRSELGEQTQAAAESVPGFAAMEALATAVHTDVGTRSANVLRDVTDGFREVVAAASAGTLTGAQTRRQAAQSAFRRLVDRGLTSFVDRSGRRWKLSSYVEVATRTVAQRAAVQGQTDRLGALGVHMVYASNAPQECALCRPYEGRVLRTDDGPTGEVQVAHQLTDKPVTVHIVATLTEARVLGFQHPNCRHSVSAYLPGVTRLPERPTADRDGDQARQRQREIERQIRKHKVRQVAALGDVERKMAGRKVRQWQAVMRQHLDDNPELKRLRYREQIGAGNQPGDSTTATGHVGPLVQPTLDGATTTPEPPHVRGDGNRADGAVPVDEHQLDLLDRQRDAEPQPPPEPEPEPGESDLARLLDADDSLTGDDLFVASFNYTGAQLDEAVAALARFDQLAAEGEKAPKFAAFVKRLSTHPDPVKFVRRRLGQQAAPAARAATLRALWVELSVRSSPGWTLPGSTPEPPPLPGMKAGLRFDSNGPAVEWAMENMPLPADLRPSERQAITTYTGSAYRSINEALRGYKPAENAEWHDRIVGRLDAAFAKAEIGESILTFRGSGPSILANLGANLNDPASIDGLVGTVHRDAGYLSTSIGNRAAFGGQMVFAFRLPVGTRAMNVMPISKFGTNEREILLNRGTNYVIHAAYQRGHTWYIECEIVPDGWTPPPGWKPDPYGDVDKGYR
ncbi:phage minor capsid protein [Saccharopolyspora sp. 6V]|uniref:phage minor capsid protein n=1 Tax=Saccharopolyspora sp. 6V TaxID=2877239 RepID=UPI001CD4D7A6|nr:phage minor capsid protein [Saccharopolyspora sp. 6V]MCA1195124.1 hypothetical protein [Saccharopolyspora sp. 6V]